MHVMIDLETLSLRKNCVVSEVALVCFDLECGIWDSFSWLVNMDEQLKAGRDISVATIQWWMRQNEAAREKMAEDRPTHRLAVKEVLANVALNMDWANMEGVWANDINFDLVILEELFREHELETPWHYRTPRSTRTLFWLAGMQNKKTHVQPEVAHSALADAVACAKTVQKAYQIIKMNGINVPG